jgi:hypothetical protein
MPQCCRNKRSTRTAFVPVRRARWIDMDEVRCFVTDNILLRETQEYHLSYAWRNGSCLLIAMGDSRADLDDFRCMTWDRLRMILPESYLLHFMGSSGRWDWHRASGQWRHSSGYVHCKNELTASGSG